MMQHIFHSFIRNFLFLFLAALCTQPIFAGYKPVDISDITGEQRKELIDAKLGIARMPNATRDAFFCEQLGLCFKKDGGQAMYDRNGYPGTENGSCFVGRSGRPEIWETAYQAGKEKGGQWKKSYADVKKFEREAVIGLFKKDVERCILNTAKYLLKKLPDEERWMLLASMGNMLYNEQETSYSQRDNYRMDCGITISYTKGEGRGYLYREYDWIPRAAAFTRCEGRGYSYLDPAGKEHDIRAYLSDRARALKYWRWRQIVWRCENLVGAKDILALFPDEVKAMRQAYKQRVSGLTEKAEEAKGAQEARNEALGNAADEPQ